MADSNKTTRVQLTLYAQNLRNVAGLGKGTSDPYAVVTLIASDPRDKPKILGKTEVIKNSLSPHWTKHFLIDFELGKPTRINVGIYDEIRKAKTNKAMGSAVFEVGEMLGARGGIKAKKLKHGGTVFCRVEKAREQDAGTFHFTLHGIKLKNVDGFLSKSDPFFEVSRLIQAAGGPSWQPVYRSKHINNDLNPKFEPVSIGLNELCEGDKDKPIKITMWDWEKSGKHTPMGSFETTVNGLMNAKAQGATGDVKSISTQNAFHLMRKAKDFGMVVVTAATISGESSAALAAAPIAPLSQRAAPPPPLQQDKHVPTPFPVPTPLPPPMVAPPDRPTFVDYISGGCELQMSVAIDFTGSNGDPRRPGTLHYIHQDGQLNDYEKALSAVGSIVAKYDNDQKFPVWGFGAKYSGVINHCFQCGREAEASGISGILEAYRGTFKTGLTMSGPTIFSEVINVAAARSRSKQEASKRIGQQYYEILLILTDGAVSDVPGTVQAIRAASDAPLSIVIVGIGNADFSDMQFLDDFQSQQAGSGCDICQFVEFSKHVSNKISLTQATLDEIPDQLVEYFVSRGIKPLPAIRGSRVNVLADEHNEEQDIDLNLEFKEESEICLAGDGNEGGVIDETSYGNFNTYAGITVLRPPPNPASNRGPVPPPSVGPAQPFVAGAPPVFHVQVPPGVTPGTQLQIQNPSTGGKMIVTVPGGVPPGGTFAVPY
jgi:hypothetical protein